MAFNSLGTGKRRPFAVTILGFMVFLSALLDLGLVILGIFALTAGQIRFVVPRLAQADQFSEVPAVGILLALSILQILLARGIFEWRSWAYRAVVLLESMNVRSASSSSSMSSP